MANKDMLAKLRERLLKKKGGFQRDPAEWRAPRVGNGEEFRAKAYILPPLEKGETCASGKAEQGMDGLFFTQVGDHWINRKKFPCPRVYDNDECPYCQLGFGLLSETDDKAARKEISKNYLPRTQYTVNLWFPDISLNPDDLRGVVKYYALPKTIFDKLEECIQNDGPGDDPDLPQPWGIFYDPQEAYPLSIKITKKGDFNNYEACQLLAAGKGKIAKSQKEIDKILDQRHDIPAKYPERTVENRRDLENHVNALLSGASSDDKDSSSGFDSDENQQSSSSSSEEQSAPSESESTPSESESTSTSEGTSTSSASQISNPELQSLLDQLKGS